MSEAIARANALLEADQITSAFEVMADEIALLRAALDEIVFTDKDPKAIATKALGWVRRDNQQLTGTEKP